jgi:hypothetical protein
VPVQRHGLPEAAGDRRVRHLEPGRLVAAGVEPADLVDRDLAAGVGEQLADGGRELRDVGAERVHQGGHRRGLDAAAGTLDVRAHEIRLLVVALDGVAPHDGKPGLLDGVEELLPAGAAVVAHEDDDVRRRVVEMGEDILEEAVGERLEVVDVDEPRLAEQGGARQVREAALVVGGGVDPRDLHGRVRLAGLRDDGALRALGEDRLRPPDEDHPVGLDGLPRGSRCCPCVHGSSLPRAAHAGGLHPHGSAGQITACRSPTGARGPGGLGARTQSAASSAADWNAEPSTGSGVTSRQITSVSSESFQDSSDGTSASTL